MRRRLVLIAALVATVLPLARPAATPAADGVTVTVANGKVTFANALVARTWSLEPFRTLELVDKRAKRVWAKDSNDFRLTLDGLDVRGDSLTASSPVASRLAAGGIRLVFDLGIAQRQVELWPDTAGFVSRTIVTIPAVLSGYTLDEALVGSGVAATAHSFRGGADWRSDEGWHPQVSIGDSNKGDWRTSVTAKAGETVDATGQWLSVRQASDARLFMVSERAHMASGRMRYDGSVAAAVVDMSRDVVGLGPIEEMAHVQNPFPVPARHRVVVPPLALEPVFTGLALDGDDEPWQHWIHLARHRMPAWPRAVTFNTNVVDRNKISTGAKDDVNLAELTRQASIARRLGVETFILDDGWQARSGDWCVDSPACPEPRADRLGTRFPDEKFIAVRKELGGMNLGLWMSPMHFHTESNAFRANPQWACTPLGDGTALVTALQPEDGSNEAGIGTWNPLAVGIDTATATPLRLIDHIERRIRQSITDYGVRYFKFDFLVWLDCVGVDTVDMYGYREAFVQMLDRLIDDHPTVTFQVDETNDYRLFPFESIARGPSWFQNGTPPAYQLLHNLWSLAPWVPGATLGQHVLSNDTERAKLPTEYLMAVGLGSHMTFWDDLTTFTDAQITEARKWVDLYKTHRDRLSTFAFPLLDDPAGGQTWTALQPWNLDTRQGMLLVYRQDNDDSNAVGRTARSRLGSPLPDHRHPHRRIARHVVGGHAPHDRSSRDPLFAVQRRRPQHRSSLSRGSVPLLAAIRSVDRWSFATRLGVVFVAYYLSARLGLRLALVDEIVTPLWPPTGVAVVALFGFGLSMWPAVALAALAVNFGLTDSPATAMGIAVGNTIAPVVASLLLRRLDFDHLLERFRDAIVLVGVALASMTISAAIGTASVEAAGATGRVIDTFWVWWAGDAMGVLIVAPVLWSAPRLGRLVRDVRSTIECIVLFTGLAAVAYMASTANESYLFLIHPLLVGIAWRFQQAGAGPAGLLASSIVIINAANGEGRFANDPILTQMMVLQAFNSSVALTSFVFASAVTERRAVLESLYQREHALAVSLQRSLLPRGLPEIPGVRLAARYLPSSRDAEVGGDWYDVIELDAQGVGLVVGDVTGHGIEAAAAMAQLRVGVRVAALAGDGPPVSSVPATTWPSTCPATRSPRCSTASSIRQPVRCEW